MFIIYADLLSYVSPNGIFLPVSGTFCLKSISNNTGAAVLLNTSSVFVWLVWKQSALNPNL